jgi:signal transduction histidine kinase
MKERAALIHARLLVESRPSDGTRVSVAVPAASPDSVPSRVTA